MIMKMLKVEVKIESEEMIENSKNKLFKIISKTKNNHGRKREGFLINITMLKRGNG